MSPAAVLDNSTLRRQFRVVGILAAAVEGGVSPLPASDLHLLAYFADALAPVWGLRLLDAQLLKRDEGPMSPVLQRDVDLLVGRAVIDATDVRHTQDATGAWRIDAHYQLNPLFAGRILTAVKRFHEQTDQARFLREVVLAVSALGLIGMSSISHTDAAYGDARVSTGRMVDIAGADDIANVTARVAMQFGNLVGPDVHLAPAEMIHLYVRELYGRMQNAA